MLSPVRPMRQNFRYRLLPPCRWSKQIAVRHWSSRTSSRRNSYRYARPSSAAHGAAIDSKVEATARESASCSSQCIPIDHCWSVEFRPITPASGDWASGLQLRGACRGLRIVTSRSADVMPSRSRQPNMTFDRPTDRYGATKCHIHSAQPAERDIRSTLPPSLRIRWPHKFNRVTPRRGSCMSPRSSEPNECDAQSVQPNERDIRQVRRRIRAQSALTRVTSRDLTRSRGSRALERGDALMVGPLGALADLGSGARAVSGAVAAAGVESEAGFQDCGEGLPGGAVRAAGGGEVAAGVDHLLAAAWAVGCRGGVFERQAAG